MQLELPFGGKVMVLGGDFRQVLPVVRKGGRAELIASSIQKSPLWQSFTIYRLTENMRVTAHGDEWKRYLIEAGNGTIPVDNNDEIAIPEELLCRQSLADEIFAPFFNGECSDLSEVVILTPKNQDSLKINNRILESMPGDDIVYKSIDTIVVEDPKDMLNLPTEFLNKMTPSELPPHELHIKKGCIVMLLKNLDMKEGLCNGTRLTVVETAPRVLGCRFACGSRKGSYVLIPRIDNYYSQDLPFTLKRRQFPVRLCFSMTINKSQGQTFSRVGISLNDRIFSHGQLHVALSRARSKEGVKIESRNGLMQNIVYQEILYDTTVQNRDITHSV
ncbi:hypothetical protein OESDEN_04725 [Oesophagostomum dentatum]|uniref:ATP-dependent DNA helicase n=1 Tax=Oesophagostomum dentatum TaxID=61180 RepID=A0A0B1TGU7_OESDE|nr:hypothetical protein OESDEN_04725 [Oesophagostomum dentatum]